MGLALVKIMLSSSLSSVGGRDYFHFGGLILFGWKPKPRGNRFWSDRSRLDLGGIGNVVRMRVGIGKLDFCLGIPSWAFYVSREYSQAIFGYLYAHDCLPQHHQSTSSPSS